MRNTWKVAIAAGALATGLAAAGTANARVSVVIGAPYAPAYYYPPAAVYTPPPPVCYVYYGRPYYCAPRPYRPYRPSRYYRYY
jgi:hypothetical protein